MKKEYTKPSIEVYKLNQSMQLLAGSGGDFNAPEFNVLPEDDGDIFITTTSDTFASDLFSE